MEKMTITEALAELKTLDKRMAKKREFVLGYLARQEGIKDPLEKTVQGGSPEAIKRERQALRDMEKRHVAIRVAIQQSNHVTPIKVGDVTRTVAEWLTWRKEVAPGAQSFVTKVRMGVQQHRHQAQQKGYGVVSAVATTTDTKPTDIIINVDEHALAQEAEELENILGTLDGQLSLKNATVTIEVE